MLQQQPYILGFAAYSGTGKTHLLIQLIPLLKQRGLRVGVIKHSHHNFEIDYPGKDSYELRSAGATPMLIVSPHRRAVITEFEPPQEINLQDQFAAFTVEKLDLILVEGFRHEAFTKIELHRPSLGKPFLHPHDSHIMAIASDQPLDTEINIPCLDLNNPSAIADFIFNHFFSQNHD